MTDEGEKPCAEEHGPACEHVRIDGTDREGVSEDALTDEREKPCAKEHDPACATAMLAAGRADGGGTMPRRQEARPSGHSSPTARVQRRVPRCINPTCGYQANTNVDKTCKYYGYCCGSCRLRHTGERYCAKAVSYTHLTLPTSV